LKQHVGSGYAVKKDENDYDLFRRHLRLIGENDMTNTKWYTLIVALIVGLTIAKLSWAATAEEAIKYRQSIFTAQQWNMQIMSRMIKGDVAYDKLEFAKRAQNLAELSNQFYEGFLIANSDIGDTRAKPEIWTSLDKFKTGSDKLVSEAAKLVLIVQGGDIKQIKMQFGETQKTCSSCHDSFRNRQ
jgi:cytochrome c556